MPGFVFRLHLFADPAGPPHVLSLVPETLCHCEVRVLVVALVGLAVFAGVVLPLVGHRGLALVAVAASSAGGSAPAAGFG